MLSFENVPPSSLGPILYRRLVLAAAMVLPLALIAYLREFGGATGVFRDFLAHEILIACAMVVAVFVTWIAWQAWRLTPSAHLRVLALGLLAFTLVYLPHGLLTRMMPHNAILFLGFGPESRLLLALYVLWAATLLWRNVSVPARRADARGLAPHLALFGGVILLHVLLATNGLLRVEHLRAMEWTALGALAVAFVLTLPRVARSPLGAYGLVAVALLAQASVAFLLAKPWNHLWWLAHVTFGAGFIVLGFGIVRAHDEARPARG